MTNPTPPAEAGALRGSGDVSEASRARDGDAVPEAGAARDADAVPEASGGREEWSAEAPADEADVLVALRFADRAARKAVAEELAGTGLHTGQELVLAKLLHHGSLPVARLAKVLDVEVPTATKTTQRMEAAGLVRRVKSATDARQVGIELTDRGIELAHTVQAVFGGEVG